MAVGTVWTLDKVTATTPSLDNSAIDSMRWLAGIETLNGLLAGHPYQMFRANANQQPGLEFTSPDLDDVLANVGVGGAAFANLLTYWKKKDTAGSVARATAEHEKLAFEEGLIFWRTLRLPHNGIATVDVVLEANYDGTNLPIIRTGSQALAGNLTAPSFFGAGPVSLNGSLIGGVQETTVETGVELIRVGGESEQYNTFIGFQSANVIVTVKTFEAFNWATVGLAGTALNGTTGLTFYARKFSGTGRVADITAQHIKFVGADGEVLIDDSAGEGQGLITDTMRFELMVVTDSAVPLVITNSSAIT